MNLSAKHQQVDAFHKSVNDNLPQVINVFGVNYRLHAQKALNGDYYLVYYSFNGKTENRDNKIFDATYKRDKSVEQVIVSYLKAINTIPYTTVLTEVQPLKDQQMKTTVVKVGKAMKPKDVKIAELQLICTELKNTTDTLFTTIGKLKAENTELKSNYGVSLPEYNKLKQINADLNAELVRIKAENIRFYGTIREMNRKMASIRNTVNQI